LIFLVSDLNTLLRESKADMIDICQDKKLSAFLSFNRIKGKILLDKYQVVVRGGIVETTVDHSDIRGLVTACHGFVAELPLSNGGS